MARYIDAELLESKYREGTDPQDPYGEITYLLSEDIDSIPTADVQLPKVAMKVLQSHCRSQESCPKCIFSNRKDGTCDINVPDSWDEREE